VRNARGPGPARNGTPTSRAAVEGAGFLDSRKPFRGHSGKVPRAGRLSALDAVFLAMETETQSLHVASVLVLEVPAPDPSQFREHVVARLAGVPIPRPSDTASTGHGSDRGAGNVIAGQRGGGIRHDRESGPPAGTLAPEMAPTSAPNTPYPYGYRPRAPRFRRSKPQDARPKGLEPPTF